MNKLLDGKVAIITGGASGIGQATAMLFAKEGASVVVSDLNEKAGNETVQLITNAGGKAFFVQADVSKPCDCSRLVNETINHFGKLDIAFNNAGIGGEMAPVADHSIEGWQKVIDVNLNSVFYCMKYQIPAMLANSGGAIVNMSSILGQVAFANSPAYVAAKHAVVGLSKNAAVEYGQKGIRVNAVGPAFIHTPLLGALSNEMQQAITKMHPIGRMGEPNEVAELVLFLCSNKASFITGNYYAVDGGYLAV